MPCKCKTEGCNNQADCGEEYCPTCIIAAIEKEDTEDRSSADDS